MSRRPVWGGISNGKEIADETERAPLSGDAVYAERAFQQARQSVRDGQPQPGASEFASRR